MKTFRYMLTLVGATIFFCGQLSASGQIKRDTKEIQQKVKQFLKDIENARNVDDSLKINEKMEKYLEKEKNKKRKVPIIESYFSDVVQNKIISPARKKLAMKHQKEFIKNIDEFFKTTTKKDFDSFITIKEKQIADMYLAGSKNQAFFWDNIYNNVAPVIKNMMLINNEIKKWKNAGTSEEEEDAKADEQSKYIVEQLVKLQKNLEKYNEIDLKKEYTKNPIGTLSAEKIKDVVSKIIKHYKNFETEINQSIKEFAEKEKENIAKTPIRQLYPDNAIKPLENVYKKLEETAFTSLQVPIIGEIKKIINDIKDAPNVPALPGLGDIGEAVE